MLQSFLKQNKGALSNHFNSNQDPFGPSVHRQQCCFVWKSPKQVHPTVTTAPTSPKYRRKKIFQHQQTPLSQLTAAFQSASLQQSKVESYRMVELKEQMRVESPKVKIKKGKGTKQNGLSLKDIDRPFKKNMRSMETIPSTLKQIMPQSNEHLKGIPPPSDFKNQRWEQSVNLGSNWQQSLIVGKERKELFSFKSDKQMSLGYSDSGWMGKSIESKWDIKQ